MHHLRISDNGLMSSIFISLFVFCHECCVRITLIQIKKRLRSRGGRTRLNAERLSGSARERGPLACIVHRRTCWQRVTVTPCDRRNHTALRESRQSEHWSMPLQRPILTDVLATWNIRHELTIHGPESDRGCTVIASFPACAILCSHGSGMGARE